MRQDNNPNSNNNQPPPNKHKHPIHKKNINNTDELKIYKPKIFQYKCHGAFFLNNSNIKEFRNERGKRQGVFVKNERLNKVPTDITCYGIESRLRRLEDLPPMTKKDAVREFVNWKKENDIYYEEEEEDLVGDSFDQRDSFSRGGKRENPFVPPGGFIGGSPERDGSSKNNKHREDIEEEEEGESWFNNSYYGRTDINFLLLQEINFSPTKRPYINNNIIINNNNNKNLPPYLPNFKVVALFPSNTLGVVRRDSGSTSMGCGKETTTIQCGRLVVASEKKYDFDEEDEESDEHGDRNDNKRLEQQQQQKKLKQKEQEQQLEEGTIDLNEFKKHLRIISVKTLHEMKKNGTFLVDEVVNREFPSRVMHSGGQILVHCGKTLKQAKKIMLYAYDVFSGRDGGGGDDK